MSPIIKISQKDNEFIDSFSPYSDMGVVTRWEIRDMYLNNDRGIE